MTIESLRTPTRRVDVEIVDATTGDVDARPRPVPGRRRAVPPAARASRRDQPGPQRGHRGGPRPRRRDLRVRPGPVPHRAAGRGRAGRGGPRVRLSPAHPIARHRRRRDAAAPRSSCRSSRSAARPAPTGSPSTATSTSSRRPRRCSRRGPRAWPSSTCWRPNGATTTRAAPTSRPPSSPTRPGSTWWSWAARTGRTCSATSACSAPRTPSCRWRAPARPEARLGDPLTGLIADWADAAREQGGLALAVHFPLPYAEVAADIVSGKIDAVEMQALTPDIDGPSIREWYRFLNCGYRLPIVGGTDKMSAEIPLGAIRTYARLAPGAPISFDDLGRRRPGRPDVRLVRVVRRPRGRRLRAGRRHPARPRRRDRSRSGPRRRPRNRSSIGSSSSTTASSSRRRPRTGATARASRSASRSRRVAGWPPGSPAASRSTRGSPRAWAPTAPRCTWTSPASRPSRADDAAAIGTIIDGARTWVEQIATVRSPAERARLAAYMASSRATLDDLVRERSRR